MHCAACGDPVAGAFCLTCGTPAGAPAVWPGARTYAVRGVGLAVSIVAGLLAVLLLLAAVTIVVLVAGITGDATLDGVPDPTLRVVIFLVTAFSIGLALTALTLLVLLIVWLYRARRNIDAFPGAHGGSLGAGWAIGGWFVPVAGFVIPCMVMHRVSQQSGVRGRPGILVAGWWGGIMLGQLMSYLPDAALMEPVNWGLFRSASVAMVLVFIVSLVSLIMLVRRVSAAQEGRIARGGFGAPGPMPAGYPTPGVANHRAPARFGVPAGPGAPAGFGAPGGPGAPAGDGATSGHGAPGTRQDYALPPDFTPPPGFSAPVPPGWHAARAGEPARAGHDTIS